MAHTPTPWKVSDHPAISGSMVKSNAIEHCDATSWPFIIWGPCPPFALGQTIAAVCERESANKIVRAVNAFEPMREALRAMRSRWGKNEFCSDPTCTVCAEEIAITNKADAALALADKEQP